MYNGRCINYNKYQKGKNMSKKIIAGALSVATAVSSFAVLGGAVFADSGWHQVTVRPEAELQFVGTVEANTTLNPSTTQEFIATPLALQVRANGTWKMQWQAVTGNLAAESTAAAGGTFLNTSGFTAADPDGTPDSGDEGVFAYGGSNANVTGAAGNTWSALVAVSNSAVLDWHALSPTASNIATGDVSPTGAPEEFQTVSVTYSATTDGSVTANETNYGTILYTLSPNV